MNVLESKQTMAIKKIAAEVLRYRESGVEVCSETIMEARHVLDSNGVDYHSFFAEFYSPSNPAQRIEIMFTCNKYDTPYKQRAGYDNVYIAVDIHPIFNGAYTFSVGQAKSIAKLFDKISDLGCKVESAGYVKDINAESASTLNAVA